MRLQVLLQLPDPDPGHVQLVLHLPQMRVAYRISAPVVPQDILRLVHRPAERQRLSHTLRNIMDIQRFTSRKYSLTRNRVERKG